MEGISKEDVMSLIYTDDYANDLINAEDAISLCKELPDQQWQTIEEFIATPTLGECWVSDPNGNVVRGCYKSNGVFYEAKMSDYYINKATIWYVMPIKTPEAPK